MLGFIIVITAGVITGAFATREWDYVWGTFCGMGGAVLAWAVLGLILRKRIAGQQQKILVTQGSMVCGHSVVGQAQDAVAVGLIVRCHHLRGILTVGNIGVGVQIGLKILLSLGQQVLYQGFLSF